MVSVTEGPGSLLSGPPRTETFSLNVTAHAQAAAANGESELNLLVAGTGAMYTCELLESSNPQQSPDAYD